MAPILTKLENHPQQATDAQVEQLAHERYTSTRQVARTEGIYLRIIVAGCQSKLGPVKRGRAPNVQAQLAVLDAVHERFYAAVLRGVTTPDIAADDTLEQAERSRRTLARNARSAFARTSKSTLAAFAKAGHDIRGLDVMAVTKASLRAAVVPAPTGDKTQQRISRSEGVLLRAIRRQARDAPEAALAALEHAMAELQAIMEGLGGEGTQQQDTTIVPGPRDAGHQRTRVGRVMLNRPQAGA